MWVTWLLILWAPFGRGHQIYKEYLEKIPVRQWPAVAWNWRFEILKTGVFGYLTPWLHSKWHKNKPVKKGLVKAPPKQEKNIAA